MELSSGTEPFESYEATGVFEGELLEDMTDTVKKTGRLMCDVLVPAFMQRGFGHPYTYVPHWAFSLPLKRGDKVKVFFFQGDLTLPVLWREEDKVDDQFHTAYEFPDVVDGGNVDKLENEAVVSCQKHGENSYVIKTENYTIVRQDDAFVVLTKDGDVFCQGANVSVVATADAKVDVGGDASIYVAGSVNGKVDTDAEMDIAGKTTLHCEGEVSVTCDDKLTAEVKGDLSVSTDGKMNVENSNGLVLDGKNGKVTIKNAQTSLYSILDMLIKHLNGNGTSGPVNTAGSPGNHTVTPGQFSSELSELMKLMTE